MKMKFISDDEQRIIINACCCADDWGGGRLSYAKLAIETAGYQWTDLHELFVFDWDEEELGD